MVIYSLDTRYGENSVISHDSMDVPAFMVSNLKSINDDEVYVKNIIKVNISLSMKDNFSKVSRTFCEHAANQDNKIVFVMWIGW